MTAGSTRRRVGVVVLVAFNVLALLVLAGAGSPPSTAVFAGWFLADAAIGLLALALTEPP